MGKASFHWRLGIALLVPAMHILLKLRVQGRENVSRTHPQIIACNHTSHADPLIVGYACGIETAFLAKIEVFRASKFLAWLIRTYNTMPVDRGIGDVGAMRNCSRVLNQGRSLILFPEGSRSLAGTLQSLRPGMALLAIINRVPIVPAVIHGVRESFLPRIVDPDIICRLRKSGAPVPAKPLLSAIGHTKVEVRFGTAISSDGFSPAKADCLRLTGQVAQAMAGLSCGGEL